MQISPLLPNVYEYFTGFLNGIGVSIDPEEIEPVPPELMEEEIEITEEEIESEKVIEIDDATVKRLALIYSKSVLEAQLQRRFMGLKHASTIIINNARFYPDEEVAHTIDEINRMMEKELAARKPLIFVCDLSQPKEESQHKVMGRIKRLIKRDQEINAVFGF